MGAILSVKDENKFCRNIELCVWDIIIIGSILHSILHTSQPCEDSYGPQNGFVLIPLVTIGFICSVFLCDRCTLHKTVPPLDWDLA